MLKAGHTNVRCVTAGPLFIFRTEEDLDYTVTFFWIDSHSPGSSLPSRISPTNHKLCIYIQLYTIIYIYNEHTQPVPHLH